MSLIDSDFTPDLFITENIIYSSFNPSTLSDDFSDLFSETSQSPPKRDIKFILSKEDNSKVNFLKKKINLKNRDWELANSNGGRWNKDEQYRFAEAVFLYGNEWKKIQSHISSRNLTQVRSHAQKFLMKLKETAFYKNLNIDLNLSWTKVMNYLRENVENNVLKEVLFSVEQNEEKFSERKNNKKNLKKSKKINKNKKLEESLNSGNESNSDTNGESYHFFFDSDESSYENNKIEEENKALEKFIACFNNTSQGINLNSSFDEISYQNQQDY
jgi:SHAQKYF class myb-like DNA-binding protein